MKGHNHRGEHSAASTSRVSAERRLSLEGPDLLLARSGINAAVCTQWKRCCRKGSGVRSAGWCLSVEVVCQWEAARAIPLLTLSQAGVPWMVGGPDGGLCAWEVWRAAIARFAVPEGNAQWEGEEEGERTRKGRVNNSIQHIAKGVCSLAHQLCGWLPTRPWPLASSPPLYYSLFFTM